MPSSSNLSSEAETLHPHFARRDTPDFCRCDVTVGNGIGGELDCDALGNSNVETV